MHPSGSMAFFDLSDGPSMPSILDVQFFNPIFVLNANCSIFERTLFLTTNGNGIFVFNSE
jgi:hypothetical protein